MKAEIEGVGVVEQLPSDETRLVVRATYKEMTPGNLFDYWIKPELLVQWWPKQAEIDAWEGGAYHMAWPSLNKDLRGKFTTFERGQRLAFTWAWDQEPDGQSRHVDIMFKPAGSDGTQLTVTHGVYTEGDKEERDGHLEGWIYFLDRLHTLTS